MFCLKIYEIEFILEGFIKDYKNVSIFNEYTKDKVEAFSHFTYSQTKEIDSKDYFIMSDFNGSDHVLSIPKIHSICNI